MASTFTARSNTYGGRYLELSITQTPDIASNTSRLDWTLSSIGGSESYYWIAATTVRINGEQVYYKGTTQWTDKVFPAKKGSVSGTTTVTHNDDGTLTIPIYFYTAVYTSAQKRDYGGNFLLDPIDRGAVITYAPDFNDTQSPQITYYNALGVVASALDACISLSGNTDDISYRPIDKEGTSYTFTLSNAELVILKNATQSESRTVKFIIRTKIGTGADEITLYSSVDKTFTVSDSQDNKPTISLAISPDNSLISSSYRSIFDGLYVEGKSKVSAVISASGRYSATILSYSSLIDGYVYTSSSFSTNAISSAGVKSAASSVTDSRNHSSSTSLAFTVLSYAKPSIASAEVFRSDSSGNPQNSSTQIWIRALRQYSPVTSQGVQKNFCIMRWRYKEASAQSYGAWQTLIARNVTNINQYNALISGLTFQANKSYNVQLSVLDDIGEEYVITIDIPTDDVSLHLGIGGKAIGIGRYADTSSDESLSIGWDTYFDKGIYIKQGNVYISLEQYIRNIISQ